MCVNHMALGAFLDMLDLAEAGISASLKVDNYTMIQWFLEMKMTGLISLGKTREAIEVMSDGSAGGFVFKKQVKKTGGEGGEASQRNVSGEFFLPEQGRGESPQRAKRRAGNGGITGVTMSLSDVALV